MFLNEKNKLNYIKQCNTINNYKIVLFTLLQFKIRV